jgi:hypothetical protein
MNVELSIWQDTIEMKTLNEILSKAATEEELAIRQKDG